MSQTGIIFAAIFAGWILFITARGELSKYLSVLNGTDQPAPDQSGGGGTLQQVGSALQTTAEIAALAG